MKLLVFIINITLSINFAASQNTQQFNNNLIAYDIRGNKVELQNDKNRIIFLISNMSCTNCINQTIYKFNNLKQNLLDSCEFILIIQDNFKDVLSCRNKITYFSEKFTNINGFLFGYNDSQESYLVFENIESIENNNYPKIIIIPQNSNIFYIETYLTFDCKKTLNYLKKNIIKF